VRPGSLVAAPTRPRPWLLAAGSLAGAAYLRAVDPTRPGGASLPCPFRAITGLDCPFCGSTRAAWALVHAEPVRALGYNALLLAFVPLLAWAWLLDARGRFDRSAHPFRRPAFWAVAGVAALAFAVVRNLPWDPWQTLGT
jgi:Protein of unknown function (DUF2752)